MSIANIRKIIELEVTAAFATMTPPVGVIYDNVQEEPIGQEYVFLTISIVSLAEPILCPDESLIENIRGSIQMVCYTPRAQGMLRLESMASVGMAALAGMKSAPDPDGTRIAVGQIDGPVSGLAGDSPLALANVSAPFTAKG